MVTIRIRQTGDTVEIHDTPHDGRPRHPEYLEVQFPQIEAIYRDAVQP
jgi:hypothetical protein